MSQGQSPTPVCIACACAWMVWVWKHTTCREWENCTVPSTETLPISMKLSFFLLGKGCVSGNHCRFFSATYAVEHLACPTYQATGHEGTTINGFRYDFPPKTTKVSYISNTHNSSKNVSFRSSTRTRQPKTPPPVSQRLTPHRETRKDAFSRGRVVGLLLSVPDRAVGEVGHPRHGLQEPKPAPRPSGRLQSTLCCAVRIRWVDHTRRVPLMVLNIYVVGAEKHVLLKE